ncbi:MAG: site-specific integrase, partial [Pseudomonadales bacterium]|nr:site-specific integrase [Pseudomonadales bacterium]
MSSAAPAAHDAVRDAFLSHLAHERQLSPRTVDGYGRDLDRFLAQLDPALALADVDSHRVRAFVAAEHRRGCGGRSIARALSALRTFYDWLAREGRVQRNPARGITAPRAPKRLPRTLDVDQAARLLDLPADAGADPAAWLRARDQACFELLYSSGLRLAELVGLDVPDLDVADGVVAVTGKGAKSRRLPVGRMAR